MIHLELLETMCGGCHRDCLAKTLLMHSGLSDRQVTQFKLIEIYKWLESERQGFDVGWSYAARKFVDEGYSHAFDLIYKDNPLQKSELMFPIVEDMVRHTRSVGL